MSEDNKESDSDKRWRLRYYEALDELEEKEKHWRDSDRLIRQLVSRLSIAADSRYVVLTKQLKTLKSAIRDGKDILKLKSQIDEISDSISELDKMRKKDASLSHPIGIVSAVLDKIDIPKEYSREKNKLKKQLEKLSVGDEAGESLERFVLLINASFNSTQATKDKKKDDGKLDEKPTRKQKLLDRILSRKPHEEINKADEPTAVDGPEVAKAQTDKADVSENELTPKNIQKFIAPAAGELLLQLALRFPDTVKSHINFAVLKKHTNKARGRRDLLPIVDVLAGYIESAYISEDEQTVISLDSDSVEAIALAVSKLLELMNPPVDLEDRVAEISDHFVQQAKDVGSLVSCLNALAEIVAEICSRLVFQRDELESFFIDLNNKLGDLGHGIQQSSSNYIESYESGKALGSHVKGEIEGMQNNIREADSFDHLKGNIKQKLDELNKHITTYQGEEAQRFENQQETITQLQQYVKSLETDGDVLRKRIEETKQQALRDVLTGIPNRQAYEEAIASEIARCQRYNSGLAMVVWDIDKFKSVNDTYGHASGDRVLKVVAELLNENIRQTDYLARYGGEEFVLLLPETDNETAKEVSDKLRILIQDTAFHFRDVKVDITISAGIAQYKKGETTVQFFERTDAALYAAKENGRNQIVIADETH